MSNPKRTDVSKGKKMLTVNQYLKMAVMDKPVSDLIRSLYGQKIMSFEQWEDEIKKLLKKSIW